MTKKNEIEILQAAIAQLGSDSYLASWLSSVAAEVESLIRSDYPVQLSIKAAITEASDAAKAIVEQANKDAIKVNDAAAKSVANCRRECNDIRSRLADAIHQAEKALNR